MTNEIKNIMRFYGRRTGRPLSEKRQKEVNRALPLLTKEAVSFCAQHPRIWMEIGFGNGQHLHHIMHQNPDDAFIGVEAFQQGVACFISQLAESDYSRTWVFPDNVYLLLDQLIEKQEKGDIKNEVLEGVYILFPDPWPKKGHERRRLLQPEFLNKIFLLLKKEGELRIGTDVPLLYDWMFGQLDASQLFLPKNAKPCFQEAIKDPFPFALSKYAEKAQKKEKPLGSMIWSKK
jgi:tRNA (guanine-N7-)-methyltransferase